MLDPVARSLPDGVERLLTEDVEEVLRFAPSIVVVASKTPYDYLRGRLPGALIVWTRHGFASKNYRDPSVAGCDFACVSSPWVRDDLLARGHSPRIDYWVTGFPAMDGVLSGRAQGAELPASFVGGAATVLYAPTGNRLIGSALALGGDWVRRFRAALPEVNLIVKPHPTTPRSMPGVVEAWREAAEADGRTLVVEDASASVYDWFHSADLLLTDASSVMFHFLALDRPVVLFRNPSAPEEAVSYDPGGPEWTWRDLGDEVDLAEDVPAAVARALADPGRRAAERELYRERVFGSLLDGRAGERIAEKVCELLLPPAAQPEWVRHAWTVARFHELGRDADRLRARVLGLEAARPRARLSRTLDRIPRVKDIGRALLGRRDRSA